MALYSSNGLPYPRGHSRAMSMVHCHALACRSVAKTRDEETAKSCGPCARALWSNVLGSIGIASTSGSVELQTGQTKIQIPATWIFALLPWGYMRDCSVDQLSRLGRRGRHLRLNDCTSQPKSCLFDRLAGCKVDLYWVKEQIARG
ncbi:hypothetical protein PCH_Pc19g00620 [Penicillium rubens Wisconsin 54-1255]|uniref:Uncharacterized protein n=1 Tax=Penicillium rubens (strain ATCC 28089 / DSM 1075 / NRRL 1951 / Wisconsin 54-1255) TaxID=500485 RepID=B6HD49_PENRW|nr:hypothetical protein PCH_Pc19g00620 [Penicillium rubens Wisconsin 54-1255]